MRPGTPKPYPRTSYNETTLRALEAAKESGLGHALNQAKSRLTPGSLGDAGDVARTYLHVARRMPLLTRDAEVNVAKRIGPPLNEVQNILRIAHTSILLDMPIGKEEESHFGDLIQNRSVVSAAEVVIGTDQQFPYTLGPIVSRGLPASLRTKSFP